jgi:hypothetical protein
MAKIGCLKPFRGTGSTFNNTVLEDGEIAFAIDAGAIYFGDGVNAVKDLTPFIYAGRTDISDIGSGSITSAISTINSNIIAQLGTIYNASSTVSFEDACIKIRTDLGTFGRLLDSKVTTSSGTYTWNRDDGANVTAIHSYAGHSNWIGGMMIDYGAMICRYLGSIGVGYKVQFIAFPQV